MLLRTVARINPRFFITNRVSIKRFASDFLYSRDHYWVKAIKDDEVRVGLSDYGQDSTGDIITIDVEKMNEPVEQNDEVGNLESSKAVASIYAPVSGTVIGINTAVFDQHGGRPQIINRDPLNKGWILKMKPTDLSELSSLMSLEDYENYLKEEGIIDEDGCPNTTEPKTDA